MNDANFGLNSVTKLLLTAARSKIVGAFAELRKATVRLVVFVRPTVRLVMFVRPTVRLVMFVRLSVHPHGTTRIPVEGFS